MRAFIAAFVDADSRNVLAEQLRGLDVRGYRLIPLENLHVTLRFLGELAPDRLARLQRVLAEARLDVPTALPVRFVGVRAFPSRRQARVLALAIESDKVLERVAVELSRVLQADFGDPDRAFHAHVTFARLRGNARPARHLPLVDVPVAIQLTDFGVYQSQTLPKGAVYQRVCPLA
jgi:RNA 2',3'-cyclic 3'-phosphodiesterase